MRREQKRVARARSRTAPTPSASSGDSAAPPPLPRLSRPWGGETPRSRTSIARASMARDRRTRMHDKPAAGVMYRRRCRGRDGKHDERTRTADFLRAHTMAERNARRIRPSRGTVGRAAEFCARRVLAVPRLATRRHPSAQTSLALEPAVAVRIARRQQHRFVCSLAVVVPPRAAAVRASKSSTHTR